jgi:hypothetical protein
VDVRFDDPNLIADAKLVPVVALAEWIGLPDLVAEHVAITAHNLTRALGCLAGSFHARATTATIRAHLISVPARLARSARRIILHLPERWPWQSAWQAWHAVVCRPPVHHAA